MPVGDLGPDFRLFADNIDALLLPHTATTPFSICLSSLWKGKPDLAKVKTATLTIPSHPSLPIEPFGSSGLYQFRRQCLDEWDAGRNFKVVDTMIHLTGRKTKDLL